MNLHINHNGVTHEIELVQTGVEYGSFTDTEPQESMTADLLVRVNLGNYAVRESDLGDLISHIFEQAHAILDASNLGVDE